MYNAVGIESMVPSPAEYKNKVGDFQFSPKSMVSEYLGIRQESSIFL